MTKAPLKTLIITGASQGIGKATCELFLKKGFEVIGLARNSQALHEISSEYDLFHAYTCDLSEIEEIQKFISDFLEKKVPYQGELQTLILNAGQFINENFLSTTSEQWQSLFQVNLLAPALLTKGLYPPLKNAAEKNLSPNVIFVSSSAGTRPVLNMSAYGSLKSALTHFSQILALEWAPDKIRVNTLAPGIVDTPIHSQRPLSESDRAFLDGLQPLKRMGQPQEMAESMWYLSQSQWSTGSTLLVDGGISLI